MREVISLDGQWDILFDEKNSGKSKKWQKRFPSGTKEIRVPSCWNEIAPEYEGVAWYHRSFRSEQRWKQKFVRVQFRAVSYYSEVWINGTFVGSHEGGYTPFELDISTALRFDSENHLIVRVIDPPLCSNGFFLNPLTARSSDGIDGLKLEEVPNSKQFYYDNFGGIWQSVNLVATEAIWIKDCFIEPDIEKEIIRIHLDIENQDKKPAIVEVSCEIAPSAGGGTTGLPVSRKLTIEPGENNFGLEMGLQKPHLWSPESPFLYDLVSKLSENDDLVDEKTSTFGMREFTIKDNHFVLNGERIILKAALFQPSYPKTLAYPIDDAFAKREIALAKESGLNMLRLHIRTAHPLTLQFADELGLLLFEEPPIGWIKKSAMMKDRCIREVQEMIRRDRNHPSVVMWGMLNETGNFIFEKDGAQSIKAELCQVARQMDPTRIVLDDSSGCYWTGELSRFLMPYSTESVEYDDEHPYRPAPVDDELFHYFKDVLGSRRSLTFISEFGFGGLEDLPAVIKRFEEEKMGEGQDCRRLKIILAEMKAYFLEYGLFEMFPTFSDFCKAAQIVQANGNRWQIEAMRLNPRIDGYCLTQFNDASIEAGAGIVDAWRNPKPLLRTLSKVNEPMHLAILARPQNCYPGERVDVAVHFINQPGIEGKSLLEVSLIATEGATLQNEPRDVFIRKEGIQLLSEHSFKVDSREGKYKVRAVLSKDGDVISENERDIFVFGRSSQKATFSRISIIDPIGKFTAALSKLGIMVREYIPEDHDCQMILVPRIANTFKEYPAKELKAVLQMVIREGKKALFIDLPDDTGRILSDRQGAGLHFLSDFFDLQFDVRQAEGSFLGSFHWVKNHPFFEGLPANCLMDQEYYRVFPRTTLIGLKGKTVAGTYSPVGFQASGSDLIICPMGKGEIVFCQLRLTDCLGSDPVADRILVNVLGAWG